MRTFIAIELSEDIRNTLGQIQSHLRYAGADVKWVAQQNIHLTLKFLGEITDEKAAQVGAALDEVARTMKPFELSLKELGVFPKPEFPKVIWVGLDKGAAESIALAGKIEEALERLGFEKETRPFVAHLTLGRVRSGKNREKLREKIATCQGQGARDKGQGKEAKGQEIRSVILFKSTLTPTGPIYSKLHEAMLQA